MVQVHLILGSVWVALLIPTLLWWKNSILWVLLISVYANIASHWGAYQAARAERLGMAQEQRAIVREDERQSEDSA